ncbi:MAG: outer membrane lipoprotein chaperone LolA [Casimicrobiaceae bacterium]
MKPGSLPPGRPKEGDVPLGGTARSARERTGLTVLAVVAFAVSAVACADGLAQLKAFNETTKSGKTAFTQTVAAKGQAEPKESKGTFSFQRPGKFRWAYERPFEQLIVGDGERLWIYDRDLNQVIVRKLDRALGSTPAALLSGGGALEANFELIDGGRRDGLDFVEAKPRTADTGFERVRIGLANNLPRTMELKDTLGNVTTLRFDAFERNAPLDAGQFRYVPPPGADIVGETK